MVNSRYGRGGWFGESYRHYLAGKGVSSARFVKSQSSNYFAKSDSDFGRAQEARIQELISNNPGLSVSDARTIAKAQLAREGVSGGPSALTPPSIKSITEAREIAEAMDVKKRTDGSFDLRGAREGVEGTSGDLDEVTMAARTIVGRRKVINDAFKDEFGMTVADYQKQLTSQRQDLRSDGLSEDEIREVLADEISALDEFRSREFDFEGPDGSVESRTLVDLSEEISPIRSEKKRLAGDLSSQQASIDSQLGLGSESMSSVSKDADEMLRAGVSQFDVNEFLAGRQNAAVDAHKLNRAVKFGATGRVVKKQQQSVRTLNLIRERELAVVDAELAAGRNVVQNLERKANLMTDIGLPSGDVSAAAEQQRVLNTVLEKDSAFKQSMVNGKSSGKVRIASGNLNVPKGDVRSSGASFEVDEKVNSVSRANAEAGRPIAIIGKKEVDSLGRTIDIDSREFSSDSSGKVQPVPIIKRDKNQKAIADQSFKFTGFSPTPQTLPKTVSGGGSIGVPGFKPEGIAPLPKPNKKKRVVRKKGRDAIPGSDLLSAGEDLFKGE